MKKTDFTKEMLDKLDAAIESVKNTSNFHLYYMECDRKHFTESGGSYWKWVTWSSPYCPGVIKFSTFGTFIYTVEFGVTYRYRVSDEVYDLLNLEEF